MKRQAKISLKTKEEVIQYDILIEFKNNKINYIDEDNTTVLLDLDNRILIRDNKKIYLEFNFFNNKGTIYIKEFGNNVNISLNTIKYEISDKKIEIMYKIEENSYQYSIEME